ncbi:uncharacterized protein LOC144639374 [Oculina patagonica]
MLFKFLFVSMMATVLLFEEASADWVSQWVKLNQDPVCFGAKDNRYGSFKVSTNITVASLMLVHQSGAVRCNDESPNDSNWGCGDDRINVYLTDHSILVPATSVPTDEYQFYTMAGYTSNSPVLVFCQDFSFSTTDELHLWYGEDLFDNGESDNVGTSCADVYGLKA